ncbi:MAG: gamma-glutamyl-gamma-aminobutyrate hydrolase family protein [Tannerella sp.]|jgi:microsomal dipeptidase-like Zn-dependent dipeptidase/gamma-glutamyl-gamma-aminobutyrate hydrolase PuuD|nr:gamma-glutamyl-gamma-aminobutyrate hydrolase family protein [Tannerella sp.]
MRNAVLSADLGRIYEEVDDFVSARTTCRLPVIGISANRKEGLSCISEPYYQSVTLAGGAPVLIPVTTDINALDAVVRRLDGLILSGGGDIEPGFFAETPIPGLDGVDVFRDTCDFILLRLAYLYQLPVMGICRGHQVLNVAFGGTLYQDIHSQFSPEALKHSQDEPRDRAVHTVTLTARPSNLSRIMKGKDTLHVNSLHHQAVKDAAPEFITTAVAPDGVNEALEHPEYRIFSVQWHPEQMAAKGNEEMSDLFRFHVLRAERFADAKRLHGQILTIDSHVDTPDVFPDAFDLGKQSGCKVNLPLMEAGHLDAAFMAAYLPQGKRDDSSLRAATRYAEERLARIIAQERLHPLRVGIARSTADLKRLKQEGRKALFMGIENGYAVGKDIGNLKKFKDTGVSYITLCHNGNNDICDSATGQSEWGGLSPFGKDVVAEMNRLGIMIDISHAAESTFDDVLAHSRFPVIASHSSARALTDHPRNLSDDRIKALAAHGGVIQICLYGGFLNVDAGKASLSDAIRHILHVVDLVGADYVGIGSDFDGDGEVVGCRAANELIQITMRLMDAGFADAQIAKIWGGNLMRVMDVVQGIKKL